MTFYELTQGGEVASSIDFADLPVPFLRVALSTLIRSGRAQIFKGTEEGGDGVKFF